jgi:hypothetical protein
MGIISCILSRLMLCSVLSVILLTFKDQIENMRKHQVKPLHLTAHFRSGAYGKFIAVSGFKTAYEAIKASYTDSSGHADSEYENSGVIECGSSGFPA